MIEALALTCVEPDVFHGVGVAGAPGRVYGGHLVAQALVGAGRTVDPDRPVHSLHGYFVHAADPTCEIRYHVTRLRDGGFFSLRQVTAVQGGRDVFVLTASFKDSEPTPTRSETMPSVPAPESLPDGAQDLLAGVDPNSALLKAVDLRLAGRHSSQDGRTEQVLWVRMRMPLPSDPARHREALAFCSDLSLAHTSALDYWQPRTPLTSRPDIFLTSLDHAVWFHRHARADEWMLFTQRSSTAGDGRGLTTAEFWSREGALIATVAQETLQRPRKSVASTFSSTSTRSSELPARTPSWVACPPR